MFDDGHLSADRGHGTDRSTAARQHGGHLSEQLDLCLSQVVEEPFDEDVLQESAITGRVGGILRNAALSIPPYDGYELDPPSAETAQSAIDFLAL